MMHLRENGALALLQEYAPIVVRQRAFARPEQSAVVLRHLLDLVALVAGASGDAAAIATDRGLAAARLRAIRADICTNLSDPALSVSAVAARRGVTVRYVHKLFEKTGSTF